MSSPFVAEIRIFPFNFAPKGWAICDGQLLKISQNTALFSLLGTLYGGDGKVEFALPNLQGSVPMLWGQGPGLSQRDIGESGGEDYVTLLVSEIPAHSHSIKATSTAGTTNSPTAGYFAKPNAPPKYTNTSFSYAANPDAQANFSAVSVTGGSSPHTNLQPYLTLTFCIALQGIYPPRT